MNTYKYSVAPENIDFNGQITIPSLCAHIINAIGQNVRREGYGVDVLARKNLSWVLIRSAFEIDARPGLYAPLHIGVWPVAGNGLTYNRCVRICDDKGRETGRGTTEWCVIDISSRRPVVVSLDFKEPNSDIPCKGPRRLRDFEADHTEERMVRYSDCDFNGHLNNTKYIDLLYDMLPEEMLQAEEPVRLDINYKKEVRCGETISAGLHKQTPWEYLFAAKSGGSTLCSASVARRI